MTEGVEQLVRCYDCDGIGYVEDCRGDEVVGHTPCETCAQTGKLIMTPSGRHRAPTDETVILTPEEWRDFHENAKADAERKELL